MVARQLRLEGFLVHNYVDLWPELDAYLVPHILSGTVSIDETIVCGLENTTSAFLSMLDGGSTGKMIIQL